MTEQTIIPLSAMARRLGVRTRWLREEAEAGRIPGVPAGDTYLFSPPAVERALHERAQQPQQAQRREVAR